MATGEEKTLVATLAIYLNAISYLSKRLHIITVNDSFIKERFCFDGISL